MGDLIRKAEDYENEIADLHNRLDIAEYDKERLREEITILEAENKEELTNEKAIAFLQDNGWLVEHDRIMTSGMENKGEWIPVSERLPKIASVYRVTRYYPNSVMHPRYLVDACFFDGSNTWYNDNRINHERPYAKNVIAWQENPEPYKADMRGE